MVNIMCNYTYRELQSIYKEAKLQGWTPKYKLNSKKELLVEMYDDYLNWCTNGNPQEESNSTTEEEKDGGKGEQQDSCNSTAVPTWDDVKSFACTESHQLIEAWSYRKMQVWCKYLRDSRGYLTGLLLNSKKDVLKDNLYKIINHIKLRYGNEHRQESQRTHTGSQQTHTGAQLDSKTFSFLINDVDIFQVDTDELGWTAQARIILGNDAESVKRNWRRLALQLHPDHGGSTHVFQQLNNIHSKFLQYVS